MGLAVGILPCLGSCTGTSLGVNLACEKIAHHDKLKPRARLALDAPSDPCEGTQSVAFECPALRQALLAYHKCPGSEPQSEGPATGGGGSINF